jgi:hypothetical protein
MDELDRRLRAELPEIAEVFIDITDHGRVAMGTADSSQHVMHQTAAMQNQNPASARR